MKIVKLLQLLVLSFSLLIVSCSPRQDSVSYIPPLTKKRSDAFVEALLNKDKLRARAYLAPEMQNAVGFATVDMTIKALQPMHLIDKELIDYYREGKIYGLQHQLTYQLHFKESWVLMNVMMDQVRNVVLVVRIEMRQIPTSIKTMNAFTFEGKSFKHYLILLASALSVLIMMTGIAAAWYYKLPKRFFWTLGCIFGIPTIQFNWTSGTLFYQWSEMQAFMLRIYQPARYAPWNFSISFPVVATVLLCIIFYYLRKYKHEGKFQDSQNLTSPPEANPGSDDS